MPGWETCSRTTLPEGMHDYSLPINSVVKSRYDNLIQIKDPYIRAWGSKVCYIHAGTGI